MGGQTISESQRKNLAYIYHAKSLTNTDYCRVSGVGSRIATRELKQLVDLGILEHANNDRWSQYRLPNCEDNSLQEHLPGIGPNKPNQKSKKKAPISQKTNILKAFQETNKPLTVMELFTHLALKKPLEDKNKLKYLYSASLSYGPYISKAPSGSFL